MPKLYGKIIKGKEFMSFIWNDSKFDHYFKNEKDFAKDVALGLKPFDPKTDVKGKEGINLVVVSDKDAICYSYNKANGPHPERFQDRDDYTDFLKSDAGIKSINDVIKLLKSLEK